MCQENKQIVYNVWEQARVDGDFEDYLKRVVLVYPCLVSGTGVVVAEHSNDPTLVDVSMYLKGYAPPIEVFQNIAFVLSELGYKFVYADNNNSTKKRCSNRICEKVGMQKIGENLYSLRLN